MLGIILTAVPRHHRPLVFNAQLTFIDPDQHPLSRQTAFGIDIEALHTDKAIRIDGTQKLRAPKELTQFLGLHPPTSKPTQDIHRGAVAIGSLAMGIVTRRVKGFDERRLLILDGFSGLGLFDFEIGQAQLHFELCFDQIRPRFALFDMGCN